MSEKIESFVAKRHSGNATGEDCSACRWISGFGLIGMGIYVLTAAKKQKTAMNRNIVYLLSAGVAGLGTARLLALPPFEHKTSD